jgi:diphthine synthase
MGLSGLNTCSLETLEILRKADLIFIEKYTNFIMKEIPELMKEIEHKFEVLTRKELEEGDQQLLERIRNKFSVLLIPGDPFIATTHSSLYLAAIQRGFSCKIIHNTSIISAAASVSGLSSYRFGRTVTCPFPENASEFPYEIIQRNKRIEAHTLVLLDINLLTKDFLSVTEAIDILLELEEKKQEKVFTSDSRIIGLAKIGYNTEKISFGLPKDVKAYSWREIGPPQALIVCADYLHFAEREALQVLWGAALNEETAK